MVSPSVSAQSKGLTQKLILQPLDQQPAPGTLNYYPAITTIQTEPREQGESDRVYVETFLIDAISGPNKKGWGVSYDNPADFDRRVQDSKNHPLVLFQTPHPTKDGEMIFDHPVAPITTLEAAADPIRATIEFQKKYTIGYAKHFKKIKDGIWHAVYEITNPKAKRFFQKAKDKGLKLFTSPHIVRPASEPDRKNIKEWAIIHNAIVSNPAFNQSIASIKDIKELKHREPLDFSSLFASLNTEDDFELDAENLLEQYVITSHDNNGDNFINMPETASAINSAVDTTPPNIPSVETPQGSTITTLDPTTNQTTQTTSPAPSLQNAPQVAPQEQKSQESAEKTELQALKSQIEALNKQNQDLQVKYAQNERKSSIEKLLAPIVSQLYADPKTGLLDEKAYNTEVARLVKSNHNQEEIQELIEARYIKAQWSNQAKTTIVKHEKASITSQVNETASFPYTKMQTNASTNNSIKEIPLGLSVLRKMQGVEF